MSKSGDMSGDKTATRQAQTYRIPLVPVFVIGIGSVVGIMAITWFAYFNSRDAIRQVVADEHLALSRTICRLALQDISTDDPAGTFIDRVADIWELTERKRENVYLCVIGPTGQLDLHTLKPEMKGTDVSKVFVEEETGQTVLELIESNESWSGQNENFRGIRQLVGYHYEPATDSLVAVHVPARIVDAEFQRAIAPWFGGVALIGGILLPISLGLLFRSSKQATAVAVSHLTALKFSEERYRGFVENSSEGIYLCEFDTPLPIDLPEDEQIARLPTDCFIAVCNDAFAQSYGYESGDEMVGMRAIELYQTGENEANTEFLRQMIRGNYRISGQVSEEFDRDGNRVVFMNNCLGIVEDGHLIRVWGTQRNITEQTRMQQQLTVSEERHRQLIDAAPICIHEIELNGTLSSMNPAGVRMMGVTAESDVCGMAYLDAVAEVDRDRISQLLEQAYHGQSSKFEFSTPDGSRHYSSCFAPLGDANGTTQRIIGITQDITEQTRSEQLIRMENEILSSLAHGESETQTLEHLVSFLESQSPDLIASVLILDDDGIHLRHRASGMLPDEYISAVDGVAIGEGVGSCGTAAFRGEPVFVDDIATDPLWQNHANLAQSYDLAACWSTPIKTPEGTVLGTFAAYRACPGPLTVHQRAILSFATDLAAVAIGRNRTEQSLRQSEAKFRTIFQQAAVGVAQLDSHSGKILQVNKRYCQNLAKEEDELIGVTWMELTHQDDLATDLELMGRLQRGEIRDFSLEKRLERSDGSFIWINLSVSPMWQPGEQPSTHIAIAEDITARKLAKQTLHISEERYRSLVTSSAATVWVTDAVGAFTFPQKMWEEYTGQSWQDHQGWGWATMIHPDDRDRIERAWNDVLKSPCSYFTEGRLFHAMTGDYRHFEVRSTPIFREDGSVREWIGATIDVHDRMHTEKELQEQHEFTRQILSTMLDGYVLTDADGNLIDANPAYCRMSGYSRDELRTMNLRDIDTVVTDDGFQSGFDSLMQRGHARFETVHRRRDGTLFDLDVSVSVLAGAEPVRPLVASFVRDISDRKQSERELRLRDHAFATSANGIVIADATDPEMPIIFCNPAFEQMTGYRQNEVLGKNCRFLQGSDRDQRGRFAIRKALRSETAVTTTLRNYRKDGSMFWSEVRISPVHDTAGRVTHFLAFQNDVTQRKQIENQLRLTQFSVDESSTALFWVCEDGSFFYVNHAATVLFGYSREQLLTLSVPDIDPAYPVEAWPEFWKQIQQDKTMVFETEIRRANQTLMPVSITTNLVEYEGQKFIFAFVSDISRRIKAEAALKISERRYRAVVEDQTEFIVRCTHDGVRTFVNDAYCRCFGKSRDELVGTRFLPSIESDNLSKVKDRLAALSLTNPVSSGDYRITLPDGSVRWHRWTDRALFEDDRLTGYQSVGRDITERKEAEHQLRQSEEQLRDINATLEKRIAERTRELQQANEDLEAYAHSVAHDLRAPLRAMLGFAKALREDYAEKLNSEAREYTAFIESAAVQMDDLIRDLLEYSRIGRSRMSLDPQNLDDIAQLALHQLEEEIRGRHAVVHVQRPLGITIGHRTTLVQLMSNLISNGIKFVDDNVTPKVRVRSEVVGNWLRLWFEDNGIGIPQESQEAIFRVFERLHGVETFPGTGIGLAIVRRAVESIGGRFGVQSEPGHGSRFWIDVKREDSPHD